jgi:uncharacterized OB-fold protein
MPRAVPVPTPVTQHYWDGIADGELRLQRCADCSEAIFYARIACPKCGSRALGWFKASGRARLHSYVINHMPAPGFENDGIYVIAIVELDEGPRLMTNLTGIEPSPEHLVVDMPLHVVFTKRDGQTLPLFRPVGASA